MSVHLTSGRRGGPPAIVVCGTWSFLHNLTCGAYGEARRDTQLVGQALS